MSLSPALPPHAAPAAAPSSEARLLLRPIDLGSHTAPNRIVFGAHLTNFGRGNTFTPRHLAYYRERAAGGPGLLVTEALTVHPLDAPYEHVPCGHDDAIVPALEAVAATVREASPSTLVLAQLNHWGGQSNGKQLRQSPWAPSATPEVASKRMARPMEPQHIEAVVEGFAAAAARVARAGLDGVELNAGQHSLLRQFLSPLTNFRTDDYGGPLENRMRLLLRVLEAVRGALGRTAVLGLKLCGDELAPWGGLTPDDAGEVARQVVVAGGADYLSMQIGGPYSAHLTEAAMPTGQGHAAYLAQHVRGVLEGALPVFTEGRVESPDLAERLLAEGQADAVVMTRALISDPLLPRKVAGEVAEPVRPHIGMTRYFSVQADWNRPLGDLANPRAGREATLPPVTPLADPRPALVVGGGPAGLEAALTLAAQGRPVTLLEQAPALGGWAARLADTVPARAEFRLLVDWYAAMLERAGVDVRLGTPLRGDEPDLEQYERICVAVGAEAPAPWFPAGEGGVASPRDLLAGVPGLPSPEAGRAVVVDREYGFRMANAVEWLLAQGYGVDVVTEDLAVGRELVESGEFLWFNRVAAQGVGLHPRLRVERSEPGRLVCRDRYTGTERVFAPVSVVVAAQPEVPASALAETLRARHPRVALLGDCRAPRLMGEAILNAHRTVLLE